MLVKYKCEEKTGACIFFSPTPEMFSMTPEVIAPISVSSSEVFCNIHKSLHTVQSIDFKYGLTLYISKLVGDGRGSVIIPFAFLCQ